MDGALCCRFEHIELKGLTLLRLWFTAGCPRFYQTIRGLRRYSVDSRSA